MANNTIETRRPDKRSANAEAGRREPPRVNLDAAPVRGRPANENDPGSSMMLAKLRRRPSYAPYYAAFFLSLTWIAGWFFTFSNTLTAADGGLASRGLPEAMRALALLALPIAIGWGIAYFLWRASQLRHVSEVLMQSAMRLIRPQDIATEGITTIAQAVRSEVDLLVGGVEHAVQRASALEEIVHKEIAAIERAFGGNEDRIRGLVAGIENQRAALHQAGLMINNDANPLLTRLETNTQNLDSVVGNAHATLNRLEKGMRDTTVDLARAMDEVAGRAATAGEAIVSQTSQLERTSSVMTGELQDFSRHLAGQIERLTLATGTLNSESSDFGRSVQGMEANIVNIVRHSVEQLTGINQEIGRVVERSGIDAARQIDQSRVLVTEGLQTVTAEYLDRVAKSRAELVGYLDNSSLNIAGAISQATESVAGNISAASAQFLSGVDQTSNRLISELNSTGSGLAGRVEQTASEIVGRLDETTRRFQGLIGGSTEDMEARIDGAAERLYGHMNATVASVAGKIDEVTTAVYGRLEQTSSSVNDLLVTTSGTIAAHLKETAEIVNRQMQDSGIALASNIETSGGIITEKLISVSGNFVQNFTRTREELIDLLAVNTKMMTERIDTTATDMTNAFAETAVRVTRQVNEANSLMNERLQKTSAEVTSQLGQTTLQITGRLEQDTGLLVDRVDRAAKELDTVSVTTAVKLDEAHRKFSQHVETANTYLADQLSTAASAIDERLESISMNLTGKLEMTGSRVTERLDDVASLVERSISKFNEEMERVLINRKDALDLLVGDAAKRADEVDAVMSSYMKLIEGSLAASEIRSKDIGRVVAEQATLAAANIEEEIGKMEASAGGQISQASRVLRDQHERAMTAMNEMLSATATDFQQTAQDMRITAQQVVKDIDGARAEMKRAIFGLPEETRNNADAMRRVVSDQISALNALAEVVKRQTGTLDLSGPGIALQRSFRESPPGKSEGATVQALQSSTVSAQQKNPERSEAINTARSEATNPARKETGNQARSETAEQTQALRGKILADLAQSTAKIADPQRNLKAAPLQALPRDMEIMVDKLNVAARDLVEAIEGTLPRDLEKRFGDGERGVYTWRIYEGRGKRLQKMIVERYGNDRLVRSRVDASVRLFEQLLDVMSSTPRGEAMVEACLASESGRIYMMLAEASGRIPPQ